MKTNIAKAASFLFLFTIICGVAYTGFITIISQVAFPTQANGSMIEVDGKVYGSALVGQSFSKDTHLWGRPVNLDVGTYTDKDGNPLAYAAPSNLSPASDDYQALVAQRVADIRAAHPDKGETPVPVELVTGSGSGLDPHISPSAAMYQAERLALAKEISVDAVEEIISSCTSQRFLGLFGEETVNVLKVNLMLDGILE